MSGWVGAVLTGGASTRMGVDKATLEVGGAPMAVRVAGALRAAGASAVVCVGRAVPGEDHVPDEHPGDGPLGGLCTALAWAGDRPVAVLACDLVAPSAAAVGRAVAALAADPVAAAALPSVEGRPQWLHGAWRPALAAGPLAAAFEAGERSVFRAVAGLRLATYDEVEALADADIPADLR